MKTDPCDREAVALLACAGLDAEAAKTITRHLAACPACQGYFAELSALADSHRDAARSLPAAELSPRLRARIATAVRHDPRRGAEEAPLPALHRPWMLAAAAVVIGLLLVGGGRLLFHRPQPPTLAVSKAATPLASTDSDSAPDSKWKSYRLALNRSPEELERLLSQEAGHSSATPSLSLRSAAAELEP
jgi:predicted anti-sigma-YlaC factor YlaD